jgi:hypothetical protein
MGLTIAAVLTAALLLPGIIGLSIFYASVGTPEVKVTPPPLGTVTSLAIVGIFAIIAHAAWSGLIAINAILPACIPMPAWDPYRLIFQPSVSSASSVDIWAGMSGLAMTCVLGGVIGHLAAAGSFAWRGRFLFGWLYPIIEKAAPPENYINAYVVTKIENGSDTLGYEGTVENLVLDEQRQIVGVTLINVSTFYLRMNQKGIHRVNAKSNLPHLVLRESDYHNVALVVIRDETVPGEPSEDAASQ